MKKYLVLLILFIFAVNNPVLSREAKESVVNFAPKIAAVVVYPDRALVVRKQAITLKEGKNRFRFNQASPFLDSNSLQANCDANDCVVQGIHSYLEHFTDYTNPELKKIELSMQKLQGQIGMQNQIRERALQMAISIKAYQKYLKKAIAYASAGQSNPQVKQWTASLAMMRDRLFKSAQEIQKAEEALARYREELQVLQLKMNELGTKLKKVSRIVEITIQSKQTKQANVSFSYIMYNASWKVAYSVYLQNDNSIHIDYFGTISQKTGEDWSNVELLLSSSVPAHGSQRPYLYPLRIYGQKVKRQEVYVQVQKKSEEVKEASPTRNGDSKKKDGDVFVEKGGASLVFRIERASSILSSDRQQKVRITQFKTSPAQLSYRLVPSKSMLAHLVAEADYVQDFPLLRGTADIYRQSGFIGQSQVAYTPSKAKLVIGFGADRNVRLRRWLSHYQESIGVVSKEKKFTTDINAEIDYTGNQNLPLFVHERVPVSQIEEIKVKLANETSSGYENIDPKKGIVVWRFQVQPKWQTKLRLKYDVTTPAHFSSTVYGR